MEDVRADVFKQPVESPLCGKNLRHVLPLDGAGGFDAGIPQVVKYNPGLPGILLERAEAGKADDVPLIGFGGKAGVKSNQLTLAAADFQAGNQVGNFYGRGQGVVSGDIKVRQ